MDPICLADYPELNALAWNRQCEMLRPEEALALYERNWRWVDEARLTEKERALIADLVRAHGNGILHV
jgi:hypothetical protein